MKIGIIGGTGSMGSGLALHLSKVHEVKIGSRSAEKARAAAEGLSGVEGDEDLRVARWCQAAIIAVPFSAIGSLARLSEPLSGKLVVSMVNPLRREGGMLQYALDVGSAAETIAAMLPDSQVATAFNNIPVAFFKKPSGQEVDVLVAAESKSVFLDVSKIVASVPGMRALFVGPLSQAATVERLTVMVLNAAKLNGGSGYSVRLVS